MNSVALMSRSAQGLSLMKAMPTFSPWPTKLKPVTCIMPSNAGCLSSMPRIWVKTSPVRFMLAPGGNCTMASA